MSTVQTTDAIQATKRAFEAAVANGDTAAMAAVYTTDGQALPPNGEVITGRAALQEFWQTVLDGGLKQVTLESREVEACGDKVIEIGRATLRAEDNQVLDIAKYIVIWKQERGQWRWHRDIWNSNTPSAA